MKKLFALVLLLSCVGCSSSTQPSNNTTNTGSGLTFHSAIFDVNVSDSTMTRSHHTDVAGGQTTTTDTSYFSGPFPFQFLDTIQFNPPLVLQGTDTVRWAATTPEYAGSLLKQNISINPVSKVLGVYHFDAYLATGDSTHGYLRNSESHGLSNIQCQLQSDSSLTAYIVPDNSTATAVKHDLEYTRFTAGTLDHDDHVSISRVIPATGTYIKVTFKP